MLASNQPQSQECWFEPFSADRPAALPRIMLPNASRISDHASQKSQQYLKSTSCHLYTIETVWHVTVWHVFKSESKRAHVSE